MTPRELTSVFRAAARRLEHERQRDLALAWHTAALGRARRMPTLRRLLNPPRARPLEGAELAQREQEFAELSHRLGV